MMSMRNKQKGMTGTGWLVVLALIGFFSLLIIKLAPVYMEYYSVKTVLASLENEPLITQKSIADVKKLVHRRLKVNGVYDVDKKGLKIKRADGVMTVEMTYQVTKHMVGNVDVLISFSDKLELVSN
jgi:hypothetical protein